MKNEPSQDIAAGGVLTLPFLVGATIHFAPAWVWIPATVVGTVVWLSFVCVLLAGGVKK